MSKWFEVKSGDIDVDHEVNEVHIWLDSDRDGNIYASLTFRQIEQIKELIKETP